MQLHGLTLGQVAAAFAGFGAAVVALYLLERRRRTVEVPFVRLWHEVLADATTTRLFSTLKRLLSLLVSLSVVAALSFALGDPRPADAARQGSTSIVLVDVSASMAATDVPGGRLAAAREEVRRRIAALGPRDRMIVAQMGATTTPLGPVTAEPRELEAALGTLRPLDVAADLDRGLRWALDVARDAPRPSIVVVSDGRLAPASEATLERARAERVPLSWARVGRGGRNVAITAFAARRYPIDPSRAQVLVELWNPGPTAEDVALTLLGDGVPIDVSSFRIGAGERVPRLFEHVSGADRTLEARITFADGSRDALAADDAAFARLPERRRARVLVVAPDDVYLQAALLLDEYLDVVEATPETFPPPGAFDVAIFESFVPAEPYPADILWLHPLPDPGVEGPFAIRGTIERPFFDRLAREHPLLRFTSLRDVNVAEALDVELRPGDVAVGADRRGPLLVAGTRAGRRFVALTFDPRRSDLPLRAAFPLLVLNAIDWFVEQREGYVSAYRTDETWHVPVEAEATRAVLVGPDGDERAVPIVEGRAVCTGARAGLYRLRTEGPTGPVAEQILAANLGPSEEAVLTPPEAVPGLGPPAPSPASASFALRAEPWTWLVLAALAIVAIEWFTFHRRWTV